MGAFEYRQARGIRQRLIGWRAPSPHSLPLGAVTFTLALIIGGCHKTPPGELLRQAAYTGTSADVDRILDQNAVDVDDPSPQAGMTALEFAVISRNQSVVTTLLTDGADPNRYDALGDNPVYFAILNDDWPMLKLLLDHGGTIKNAWFGTKHRATPLMVAAFGGSKSMVEHLLALGADPSQRDSDGMTVADHLRRDGDTQLIELLEDHATTQAK